WKPRAHQPEQGHLDLEAFKGGRAVVTELDLLEQCIASMMRDELESRRLDVVLVPCTGHMRDEGKMRRVAIERNPEWYRQLCSRYPSSRKPRPRQRRHVDTLIKRKNVLRALERLANNGKPRTLYDERLIPVIKASTKQFANQYGDSQ
ncbi:MAG: hypothetical protein GY943_11895, partial [Chloroflexi bacterium]|nr:hypothetical protein [Chloroflexota bacterium]